MNLKQMDCNKCLSDFILIFLIFGFLTFPKKMDNLAQSILGIIIAIILIIYYTWNHILYGLLFCVIVILYYQIKFYENPTRFTFETFVLQEPSTKLNDETIFKQNNCVNGDLKYKEFEINPEMGEHIFPIHFNHNSCNPCNPKCKFSLINHKINVETEIVKPKNSNDMFNVIMNRFGL